MTARVKTIRCQECGKRFVPKRAGRGVVKEQICPYCSSRVARREGVSALKRSTWAVFSQWLKLSKSDHEGYCTCVTCGIRLPWDDRNMHAGHFLQSRSKGILFEPDGVNPQCHRCNVVLGGNKDEYWPWMLRNRGQETIDRLLALKWKSGQWTREELLAINSDYSARVADILSRI